MAPGRTTPLAIVVAICAAFGLLLAGLAVIMGLDVPVSSGVDCDRGSGLCTFTRTLLTGTMASSAPLGTIGRAEVRTSAGRGGQPRVSLHLVGGPASYYVADYGSSAGPQAQADAARLNAFLGDPTQRHVAVERRGNLMYWVAGGGIVATAVLAFALLLLVLRRLTLGAGRARGA